MLEEVNLQPLPDLPALQIDGAVVISDLHIGMETKLKAAKLATGEGIDTHIISGYAPEAIYRVLEGAQMGTWFKAVK